MIKAVAQYRLHQQPAAILKQGEHAEVYVIVYHTHQGCIHFYKHATQASCHMLIQSLS